MPIDKAFILDRYHEQFGTEPRWVVRAPGRVNLIGEHTDYNDGFVLPLAIDRAVWIALRPRDDGQVVVHSLDYHNCGQFTLAGFQHEKAGWIEYLKGVAWSLQQSGFTLQGFEAVMAGDVPAGAGLSSSAALEVATARALAATSDLPWDGAAMALAAQRAENKWVGVNCGIMDQLISALGRADHALLVDCRSLETTNVPLPAGVAIVVLDTGTRRGLVDSAYNERRAQCEAAARYFGVKALRDVTPEVLAEKSRGLDPLTLQRARHVISENARTVEAAEAMRRGDVARLGQLMKESHVSLRDDYEVSSDALNAIVDISLTHSGCIGARMTGAGFGGCAVAIVRLDAADDFAASTAAAYQSRTGNKPAVYVCSATNGAALV
jgi:galactokinase